MGRCRVIDLGDISGLIHKNHLVGKIGNEKRILIRTSYSGKDVFSEQYPSLGLDAAVYLVSCGVICIGIDSPSIESFQCDGAVHRHLLENSCIIIELLDLSGVPPGTYGMAALPIKLAGLDGAPARVILTDDSGSE